MSHFAMRHFTANQTEKNFGWAKFRGVNGTMVEQLAKEVAGSGSR
jgi:hypothetical protein